MRVGTLTFPGSPSHGAALQMYALWKVLHDLGCDVEVINYSTDIVIHNRNKKLHYSTLKKVKNSVIRLIIKNSSTSFQNFESKVLKYPIKAINTPAGISAVADRYDRIIVGSDQVWNPIVTGNDMNFYLKFIQDSRAKSTYAPSFGSDDVADEDKEEIAKYLSDITYLCARETQGAQIIKNLTGRDVPVVLDPTFLIEKMQWETLEKKPKYKKEYVLFYNIKPSPSLRAFAQKLADENNLILVTIGGGVRDKFNPNKHPEFGVGPAEFLGLINNAKYVVTNSFHGTAFSIIYRKNFYVEYSTDTNSRLINIINTLDLKECVVTENTSVSNPVSVDYSKSEILLEQNIKNSMDYLKTIIEG